MAITFIEQKKRQRYFLIALGGVGVITAFVLWQGFLSAGGPAGPVITPPKTIQLDFNKLDNEALQGLNPPPAPVAPPQDPGQSNPFLR